MAQATGASTVELPKTDRDAREDDPSHFYQLTFYRRQDMFAGSVVRNDLDVAGYMPDDLQRALDGETNWPELAPHLGKLTHPESIRAYGQEERRHASDRK